MEKYEKATAEAGDCSQSSTTSLIIEEHVEELNAIATATTIVTEAIPRQEQNINGAVVSEVQ